MLKLLFNYLLLWLVCLAISVPAFGADYIAGQDGTVTDTLHGLMWQQGDDGVERNWRDAGKYCEDLKLAGKVDWRLPSVSELDGLIKTANSPMVPAAFTLRPSYYWSASESRNNSQSAKYVNFFYGHTYAYSKDNTYYVICVRNTAATPPARTAVVDDEDMVAKDTGAVAPAPEAVVAETSLSPMDKLPASAAGGTAAMTGGAASENMAVPAPAMKAASPSSLPPLAGDEAGRVTPFMEITVKDKDKQQIKTLGHGLLAYAFANAMRGDADWNKDGLVTFREMRGYINAAVPGISLGEVLPKIQVSDENTGICAPNGTTYLLAAGVDIYHDDFIPQPFVKQDIAALQQVIAGKCLDVKAEVLTGEHANRAEFLQVFKKVGGLIGPNDHLIFYFTGLSERQGKRLNLLFNDTIRGMTAFTGLFYDDIVDFLKNVPGGGTVVLLETSGK